MEPLEIYFNFIFLSKTCEVKKVNSLRGGCFRTWEQPFSRTKARIEDFQTAVSVFVVGHWD